MGTNGRKMCPGSAPFIIQKYKRQNVNPAFLNNFSRNKESKFLILREKPFGKSWSRTCGSSRQKSETCLAGRLGRKSDLSAVVEIENTTYW
jgi:hypothetical protein